MLLLAALHYAVRAGHLEVCKILIANGANLNAQTNGGATPLHRAAMMGNESIVGYLLSGSVGKQVNLLLQDCDGRNALHRAVQTSNLNIVKMLVEKDAGSLVQQCDTHGNLPIDLVPENDCEHNEELRRLLTAIN